MGEVGMEVDAEARKLKKNEEKDGSSEVVRWERFLPRMVLRVLLVEADDSTRQIISALLRKCGYKVSAVPDGLMAWETLKDQPYNIDLILTEVELPSISGFALLTLVMEHDICKNIPVIMMSSHDSISMVLKCMLKGAADFLTKPVRRNELRNLWQHVWRRHTLAGGRVPHGLPTTEHIVEATAENNSESNQSSDYGSSIWKNKEGSDTQVLSQLNYMSTNLRGRGGEQQGNVVKLGQESLQKEHQVEGISVKLFGSENSNRLLKVKEVAHCREDCETNASKLGETPAVVKKRTHDGEIELQRERGNVNVMTGVDCKSEFVEPSTEAIDLIGSFDNQPKGKLLHSSLSDSANKFEFSPQLELSLRRSCFSSARNQGTCGRPLLNHSDASAFSWYINSKSLQPILPTPSGNQNALKEGNSKSRQLLESNNDITKLQSELTFPSTQHGLIPVPGVRMDDIHGECNDVLPQASFVQSGLPPARSPKPAGREHSPFPVSTSAHTNPDVHGSKQGYHRSDVATNCSIDQTIQEQNRQESLGKLRCNSPIADQSISNGLCNIDADHENSSTHEGVSSKSDASATATFAQAIDKAAHIDADHENSSTHEGVSSKSDASATATFAQAIDKGTTTESFNDSNFFIHDGLIGMDTHWSSQREAALRKFRLKRKDRCFQKKVRYQSRKKLAEQRPRVRGQFVRQVQNDSL